MKTLNDTQIDAALHALGITELEQLITIFKRWQRRPKMQMLWYRYDSGLGPTLPWEPVVSRVREPSDPDTFTLLQAAEITGRRPIDLAVDWECHWKHVLDADALKEVRDNTPLKI